MYVDKSQAPVQKKSIPRYHDVTTFVAMPIDVNINVYKKKITCYFVANHFLRFLFFNLLMFEVCYYNYSYYHHLTQDYLS